MNILAAAYLLTSLWFTWRYLTECGRLHVNPLFAFIMGALWPVGVAVNVAEYVMRVTSGGGQWS